MKKIGIITLNGNINYGNRLQNYALQEILCSLGYETKTIVIENRNNSVAGKAVRILKSPQRIIRKITNYRTNQKINLMIQAKEKVIFPFTKSYIKTVRVNQDDLKTINEMYDYFVVGSDQVWNPNGVGDDRTNFLYFADKDKRISYAASFGVAELSKKEKNFYRENLAEMHAISVREDAGVEIVRDLLGNSCEKVVDPTMLLDQATWKQVIGSKKEKHEEYVLIYMMRGMSASSQMKIEAWAEKRKLKIIQIMGDIYDENHVICDPLEYVDLISNAKMVFTDSFHGCVFSIIMHTPFLVFKRNGGNMYSRISALLKQFDMMNNEESYQSDFDQVIENTDFSKVDQILISEREKGLRYLEKAFTKI